MTGGWTGSDDQFLETYSFLITQLVFITTFMTNFHGNPSIFNDFFANFSQTHPYLGKICRKKDPCLETFLAQTHPYGQQIPVPSTCYVPPGHLHGLKLLCICVRLKCTHLYGLKLLCICVRLKCTHLYGLKLLCICVRFKRTLLYQGRIQAEDLSHRTKSKFQIFATLNPKLDTHPILKSLF